MGGIIVTPRMTSSSATFTARSSSPTSKTPTTDTESEMQKLFFQENQKVLTLKRMKIIHPELRKLRLILGCDYGRPKLIQFLLRTTSIEHFTTNFDMSYEEKLDYINHFIQKFHNSTHIKITKNHTNDLFSGGSWGNGMNHISSPYSLIGYELYSPQIILLTIISNYHHFLQSIEYADWLKYQNLLNDSRSRSNSEGNSYHSESLRSTSHYSTHHLSIGINNLDYCKLLDKSHWIVAFAHLLQMIPYPVSILGRDNDMTSSSSSSTPHPFSTSSSSLTLTSPLQTNKSSHLPISLPHFGTSSSNFNSSTSSTSVVTTSATSSSIMKILYANTAFLELIGYTKDEILQHNFDKYHSPSLSSPSPGPATATASANAAAAHDNVNTQIIHAINSGQLLKIGLMFYPHTSLPSFFNLQTYIPLYNPEGTCHHILILHCDIMRYSQHYEYLQKLDFMIEILTKTILSDREYGNIFLKSFFYNSNKIQPLPLNHSNHQTQTHSSSRTIPIWANSNSQSIGGDGRSGGGGAGATSGPSYLTDSGPFDSFQMLNDLGSSSNPD